ncbi:DUF2341 domain-containing protein [Methanococcus maripaludis]|uniref:Conserved hypothetical archaeal protein n=1 Tax=Methanococcus maripaludis (strain DSM 14266 / JCM 13030 / NBRC 101832 / S2 / LL) TaxID=267377 RepID=Q6M0M9_METMP|nr:DUF2341 domain-containing protein [Methanococcus maripaludis]CAF29797.1 conserved hypothetical archaeal protein [Methanococcus maripaludis S2]
MYLSHTTVTLVLLMMLTATMIYTTIDLQKDQIITESIATSVDLRSSSLEHVVETSIPIAFNKVLNDMELQVMQSGTYYENESYVLENLTYSLDSEINGNLETIKNEYSSEYDMDYDFEVTNITMVDGFTFKVDYDLEYYLAKENVYDSKNVSESQEITVKTIISAYHYLMPKNLIEINSPSDLTDYQFKVVLTDTDFDFSENNNGSGIEFIDEYGNSLPYWIEYWNYDDKKAIVWLNGNLTTGINYINITTSGTGVSNGGAVFELFEGFENLESNFDSDTIFYTTIASGTWENDSLDSLLISEYNEKMVKCENAPIFAKVISDYDMNHYSLSEYIVEVNAKGNNSDGENSPNVMVGFFVDLDAEPTYGYHPESFYTADLGGVYNDHIYEYSDSGFRNAPAPDFKSTFGISNEYPDDKNLDRVIRNRFVSSLEVQENIWYYIKLKINESITDDVVTASFMSLDGYVDGLDFTTEISYAVDESNNYLLLGTSVGSYYYVPNNYNQSIYFDNFRVRKYVQNEPTQIPRYQGLYYISPPRGYGTVYGTEDSENLYFIENNTEPSIIDMLAGKGSYDGPYWNYGYGIKLVEN